jgi:site-specific DNA recombinase
MKDQTTRRSLRSAIYTRVSTEQGLEQDFNSLDAQREACEAYIKSQAHEGWRLVRDRYDDGGFSGGSMVRPALQKLLVDVQARRIDVVVVYKVDRLTRSLADFAKLVETFDANGVSFVSVTQTTPLASPSAGARGYPSRRGAVRCDLPYEQRRP